MKNMKWSTLNTERYLPMLINRLPVFLEFCYFCKRWDMNVDFKNIKIETDENMLDNEGEPRLDALIFENCIKCHPALKERLEEALRLFFDNQEV